MHLIQKCLRNMKSPKEILKLEDLKLYRRSLAKLKKFFTFLDGNKDLKELVNFTLNEMQQRNYIFCPEQLIENYKKDGVWQLLQNLAVI